MRMNSVVKAGPSRIRTKSLPGGKSAVAVAILTTAAMTGCSSSKEPQTDGGPIVIRRLTGEQYRHSIADVFGSDIKIAGRFEPGVRKEGLLAVGAGTVTITPAGFEQFQKMARSIAAQVVDEQHRAALIPCKPASATAADETCVRQVLQKYGRLLVRRPLATTELNEYVAVANTAADTLGDFYAGAGFGLTGLLVAPEFLFRKETSEPDPSHPGAFRLDAYSKASRLSFLLWDTTPDDELLTAAERGELHEREGLARQVDRLLGSQRLQAGVRSFFADILGFDRFDNVAKDTVIYPKFGANVAADAREQTLRTITDLLITRNGDYRDLFTTRRTSMTRWLGMVYAVPVESPDGWEPYEFPEGDPRTGILSQVSFLSLYSHPGRSSPTLRGKALRELLLCQPVPPPPNNVNFANVQDTHNPKFRTARDRLGAHRTDAVCAGCHKITDPIGLALEHFDSLGEYRDLENGAPIDTSGDFDGMEFRDSAGLGKALHDSPIAASCLVSSVYRYATGRGIEANEKAWAAWLDQRFVAEGYQVPALLRQIAMSEAFYRISVAAAETPVTHVAARTHSVDEDES